METRNERKSQIAPRPANITDVKKALGMGPVLPAILRASRGTGKSNMLPDKRQMATIYYRFMTNVFPDVENLITDLVQQVPIGLLPRLIVTYTELADPVRDILEQRLRGTK